MSDLLQPGFLRGIASKLPVKPGEWHKFLLTAALMTLTVYVYSVLRGTKDALIIPAMGAELISTLKFVGVTPSAILFMLIYTKIVDVFSRLSLYHIMNWFFIGFFALFMFVLFPNAHSIHPDLSHLIERMPYFKYIFLMISGWSYSLFYIFSELWGSVMLTLMFWQMANQITEVSEAKRFYPLFGFVAQAGLTMAGQVGLWASGGGNWNSAMQIIITSVVIAGCGISYCLYALQRLLGTAAINESSSKASAKKKVKMGFKESLKYVLSSKYVGLIALIVICYGTSINIVEGVWKKAMSIHFADPAAYSAAMGQVQYWTGIVTAVIMLCGSYLLRIISWFTAAVLTPIMILVTGSIFFTFMVFRDALEPTMAHFGLTAIFVAVVMGAAQNILSKATKYSFFDPTKEMAYIAAEEEVRTKGKSAADVIGGRLGKASGGFIQMLLLSLFPVTNLLTLSPIMFAIFAIVMVLWFFSVTGLNKEFLAKSKTSEQVS